MIESVYCPEGDLIKLGNKRLKNRKYLKKIKFIFLIKDIFSNYFIFKTT